MGVCLNYQDPKHLSSIGILLDFRMTGDICLHLLRCQLAQRMRLIAERISKPLWRSNLGIQRMQMFHIKGQRYEKIDEVRRKQK